MAMYREPGPNPETYLGNAENYWGKKAGCRYDGYLPYLPLPTAQV